MAEGQLTLLAEPNDCTTPGSKPRQFNLMAEGQLTLLAEPNDCTTPGSKPRQFYLMQEGTPDP